MGICDIYTPDYLHCGGWYGPLFVQPAQADDATDEGGKTDGPYRGLDGAMCPL